MKRRVLHIEISTLEQSLKQFGAALEDARRGKRQAQYEGVGFENLAELLALFTQARWALIERLRQEGPLSVYALAKLLARDYKNVRSDVIALETLGIIERDPENRVLVPWDEIDVRVPLAA